MLILKRSSTVILTVIVLLLSPTLDAIFHLQIRSCDAAGRTATVQIASQVSSWTPNNPFLDERRQCKYRLKSQVGLQTTHSWTNGDSANIVSSLKLDSKQPILGLTATVQISSQVSSWTPNNPFLDERRQCKYRLKSQVGLQTTHSWTNGDSANIVSSLKLDSKQPILGRTQEVCWVGAFVGG